MFVRRTCLSGWKIASFLLLSPAIACLAGCHSAYIAVTVSNRTDKTISLLEVDYPSASFGTQSLAAGQDFRYRFKVLGSGPVKITWTDAARHELNSTGPTVYEGDEGPLRIVLSQTSAQWTPGSFTKK